MHTGNKEDNEKEPVILFADDDDLVLDVGVRLLQKIGYMVLEAKDGHQAVDLFSKNKDRVDLVILDMKMPFNGEKAFRKLKEIKDDIKILITSGWVDDYRVQKMIDQGCNGFIQKPFNLAVLSDKIKAILGN